MNILHDSRLCIGCRACQTACQDTRGLPANRKIMEILEQTSSKDNMPRVEYTMKYGHLQDRNSITRRSCSGCAKNPEGPVCVRACPLQCLSTES